MHTVTNKSMILGNSYDEYYVNLKTSTVNMYGDSGKIEKTRKGLNLDPF